MVSIFKELSLKYCIPEPVIKTICQHPFMFASRVMADEEDEKSIMFAYLGKLKLKNACLNNGKKYDKNKFKNSGSGDNDNLA
jgi:hypothetical protein